MRQKIVSKFLIYGDLHYSLMSIFHAKKKKFPHSKKNDFASVMEPKKKKN